MASGKQTPRQKMIGMMYLVLTALLALNISKEIINAFVTIETGLNATNKNFDAKNDMIYNSFYKAKLNDEKKVAPLYANAMKVKDASKKLCDYINELKSDIKQHSEGIDKKKADTLRTSLVEKLDDYDTPTHFMIGDDPANVTGKAKELKAKLVEHRKFLATMLPKGSANKLNGLSTDDQFSKENEKMISWEWYNFYHAPLAATMAQLSRIQNEIKNAESDVVNELFASINANDFKFDALQARIIAESSYILAGDDYKADVFVAATSSTQQPVVWLFPEGESAWDSAAKKPKAGAKIDSSSVAVAGGMGHYLVKTGNEGLQSWAGVIRVKKPDGAFDSYPFKGEYMVAKPAAAVSPDKMNVFYIGVDNPVTITAAGVAPENLSVNISGGGGSISGSRGKYVVKVSTPGECNVSVSAKYGTTSKPMGAPFKFRVKRVPDPVAYVGAIKGDGIMTKAEVAGIRGVFAKMENFDFDLSFTVVSFVMSMNVNGVYVDYKASGPSVTADMSKLLGSAKTGTKVFFEQINVKGPDGSVRKIPGVNIKVK